MNPLNILLVLVLFILFVLVLAVIAGIIYLIATKLLNKEKVADEARDIVQELLSDSVEQGPGGVVTASNKYIIKYNTIKASFAEFPLDKIAYVMTVCDKEPENAKLPWKITLYTSAKMPLSGKHHYLERTEPAFHSGSFNVPNEKCVGDVWEIIHRHNANAVRVDEYFNEIS